MNKAAIGTLVALVCFSGTTAHFKYSKDFFTSVLNNLKVPIAQKCEQQYKEFITNFSTSSWPQQMVDANSEVPIGPVTLDFEDMGDFQQCIDVKASTSVGDILGKYCLGYVSVNNKTSLLIRKSAFMVPPVWAICVPNGCTTDDVNLIGNAVLADLLESHDITVGFSDLLCQTIKDAKPKLSTAAIFAIVILALLLLIVFSCTLYDIYGTTKCPLVIESFSIYANTKNIFKHPNPHHLPCLEGLRSISLIWIVIVHQFGVTVVSSSLTNSDSLIKWPTQIEKMFIAGGTVAVDTFLTIGGTLMSFGFMKARQKKVPFNVFWYYLHRYVRLTAALSLVVLVSATVLKYVGSGPKWPYLVLYFQKNCEKNWWLSFLYVQNYVNNRNMCVGQTWYLDVDMQLYIISPVIFFMLWKYPKLGMSLLVLGIVASTGSAFYAIWQNKMPAIQFGTFSPSGAFEPEYYLLTHTRATPWIIGVILGYFMYKIKQNEIKLHLNKYLVGFIWSVCFGSLFACVLGGQDIFLHQVDGYDIWANAMYAALARPAWSIAIGWIIFACSNNHGGPVNWVLSLSIFQVFGKFTYSIYLTHVTALFAIAYSSKTPKYYSDFAMVYEFWGTLWLSIGSSIIIVFLAEYPLIRLEKILEDKFNKKRKQKIDLENGVDNAAYEK